jgi:hypothetical protein
VVLPPVDIVSFRVLWLVGAIRQFSVFVLWRFSTRGGWSWFPCVLCAPHLLRPPQTTGFRSMSGLVGARGAAPRQRGIYSDFPATQEVRECWRDGAFLQLHQRSVDVVRVSVFQVPLGPAGSNVQSSLSRSRTTLTFKPTESSAAKLEGKLHAAAEVRVSKSVEPKVFVPHERRPGMPPRKVEVERKKRFYAAQVQLIREPRRCPASLLVSPVPAGRR